MHKKLICLTLALAMLCMVPMAFAAPSKTTGDMSPSDTGEVADTRTERLDEISNFVASGKPVVDYFGRDAVASALSGANLDSLVLYELISINLPLTSGMTNIGVATKFPNNVKIVAILGIVNADGTVTWIPLKATVANGVVKVNFTKAALEAAAGHEVILAILSTPIA